MNFFIFVFLAWLVDNVRYIGRPIYFMFTSSYWTPSLAAKQQRKSNLVLLLLLFKS